jgi:hypothetical protein
VPNAVFENPGGTIAAIVKASVKGTFSNVLVGGQLNLAASFDALSSWNAATGLFTAARTADYLFSGSIAYVNTTTFANGYEILYLNGGTAGIANRIAWGYHAAYTGYWGMSGAIVARLSAGQTCGMTCTRTTGILTGVDSSFSITEL